MIFETDLLPYGRRVNERGYGTALPDSGFGLIPGESSDAACFLCIVSSNSSPRFSWLVTGLVTVDGNIWAGLTLGGCSFCLGAVGCGGCGLGLSLRRIGVLPRLCRRSLLAFVLPLSLRR